MIAIPMKLPSAANLREHWAVKAKRVKAQRKTVALAMLAEGDELRRLRSLLSMGATLRIVLTRSAPRKLDDDNLASAFKAVRDEVAKQLGVDDGSDAIEWRCIQAPGAGLPPYILITVGPAVMGLVYV